MTIQSYASARTLYTTCGQFVVFYICQKSRGLTLEVILHKYFSTHNKLRNDLLVRDFVKLHYHHDAKVMDPNFIKRVSIKSCPPFWQSSHPIYLLKVHITLQMRFRPEVVESKDHMEKISRIGPGVSLQLSFSSFEKIQNYDVTSGNHY